MQYEPTSYQPAGEQRTAPVPSARRSAGAASDAAPSAGGGQDAMSLIRQRMLELAAKGQQAASAGESRIPAAPGQPAQQGYQYAPAAEGSPGAGPGFRYAAAAAVAATFEQATAGGGGGGLYSGTLSVENKPPSRGPTPLQVRCERIKRGGCLNGSGTWEGGTC